MMTAGHLRGEYLGVSREHPPHLVDFVERYRRPYVVRRPVADQVVGNVLAHLPEAGRPPKDADPGVVPSAIDVGTRLDQQPDHIEIAVHRREMQRRRVVWKLAGVEIGTALDEQMHSLVLVAKGRQVQRGGLWKATTRPGVNAEHLWAFVDEPLVNSYFETIEDLDKAVGQRCVALTHQQETIRASTLFHWWPRPKAKARAWK